MGSKNTKKVETTSRMGKPFTCPFCLFVFNSDTTYLQHNSHMITCSQEINQINLLNESILPERSAPFEDKLKKLRNNLVIRKVDWREAYCVIEINRENATEESLKEFDTIDPYKELQIKFKGEVSYDAGGIIREWFTVLIKDLESQRRNLFVMSDNSEVSYIVNLGINLSSNAKLYRFIGKLIAKALIDNIAINLCFNKIIYKLILNEKVTFDDLVFIDKQLYQSLCELKKLRNLEDMGLYFVCQSLGKDGSIINDELVTNGSNIQVTQSNLEDYINRRVEYMVNKHTPYIKEIKKGLYDIIPKEFLMSFNSDELELILCGQPYVDVEDWKDHTQYRGKFNAKHKVVKWFWDRMASLNQEELSRFLQFATGTSRVPIGGFASLESNRGEISHFCIVQVPYVNTGSNYIKAHTCFNRIDLPMYPNEKQLVDAINYVIRNEILGFGID